MAMANREREVEIGIGLARRAYLYRVLHIAFGSEPAPEGLRALFGDETREAFQAARDVCGTGEEACARSFDAVLACIDGCAEAASDEAFADELRGDYLALFQLPGSSYVPPWESSFASDDRMLFQESTLDVRSFYHRAGFRLQAEKKFPDDHVAAMMDFMARLSQEAYDAFADGDDARAENVLGVQVDFAEKHLLSWIDDFAAKVAENDARECYAAFAAAMAAFVRDDAVRSKRLAKELAAAQE